MPSINKNNKFKLIFLLLSVLIVAEANDTSGIALNKINSPEVADEVIVDDHGYKHWKIEDVWYSNKPLEPFYDKIDTVYYDEIRMNPYFQPNDSNFVWYGSGDVDSNNVLDGLDSLLIADGNISDQADIDGDGILGTSIDAEIFGKYLNSDTSLIQHKWNFPDTSPESRKAWLDKMLAIDKTDTIPYIPGKFECGAFSMEVVKNFRGFGEINQDTSLISEIDPSHKHDFSTNGRFNLPVFYVTIKSEETELHHAIVGSQIDDKEGGPLRFFNWNYKEPQNDSDVPPGHPSMPNDSRVRIYHSFFYFSTYFEKNIFLRLPFIEFKLTDGNPELISYDERLILQRPQINSIKPRPNSLEKFVLNSNYPNPFNSNTSIQYSLPRQSAVNLMIYDITGRMIKNWQFENQSCGWHEIIWNGTNSYGQQVSTGVYIYQLQAGDVVETKKMVFMK